MPGGFPGGGFPGGGFPGAAGFPGAGGSPGAGAGRGIDLLSNADLSCSVTDISPNKSKNVTNILGFFSGAGAPNLNDLLNDPEVLAAFQVGISPRVSSARVRNSQVG